MMNSSRRLLFFAVAFIGALGLLAALLLFFTRSSPHDTPTALSTESSSVSGTPSLQAAGATSATGSTSHIVASVDDEPLYVEEWRQAIALDQVMSGLVGQARPSPEETLSRLVNERLVLRAAESAGLPEADTGQAEAWLANFLASLKLDDEALEQSLNRVGLTRADLLGEILPRLLQVQQAIESLAPGGDEEAWVSSLRRDAEVVILENVSSSILQDLPAPEPTTQPPGPVVSSPTAVPMGPQVGDQAPDFRLGTMDGSTVRLADLDNHPVILSFWATWCDPCRDELQMLDAIKSEDLIVLPTAVRQPPEQVAAFAADLELDLPLLLDANGQVGESYQVRGLPTSLFVDRQGVVVARHVGPLDQETLDSYLDILMGETPSPSSSP